MRTKNSGMKNSIKWRKRKEAFDAKHALDVTPKNKVSKKKKQRPKLKKSVKAPPADYEAETDDDNVYGAEVEWVDSEEVSKPTCFIATINDINFLLLKII